MKNRICMFSQAHTVKGQGVGSAYEEQVSLVKHGLHDKFSVLENKPCFGAINHYHTINLGYFLATPFAKKVGKTVGYVHFLPETVETSLQLPWICKKIFYSYMLSFYKRMDHLVTVNPYFIDRLETYGIPREKVTYIPNFVSETEFYPVSAEEKQSLRQQYNLDPQAFTVVCAGQLQTRKGVLDFVRCAEAMPHLQFVWAGGFSFGRITDGYQQIKKVLANPPKNLHFLGLVDRSEMNAIFNLGDVMFLPSFEELFPVTILEAMNCGIPLLLRDIPIYENILFDFYEKAPGMEGFLQILNRLSTDDGYYQTAKQNAHRGHLFYNRKHVLEMWDDFYSSLLQESPVAVTPKALPRKKIAD